MNNEKLDFLKNSFITELRREVNDFVTYFESKPGEKTTNPFFGHLNYEEWVQILYKHVHHHLRQFGATLVN